MRNINKNILDLNFQKHLVTASTAIVVLFTYVIGIFIAFVTGGLNLNNYVYLSVFLAVTLIIIGFCVIIFIRSYSKIKSIPEEINTLK